MSDYINGLNNSYLNSQYSPSVSELKDKITDTDFSKATEEELMEACKSFEQYFIEQAFKGMEKMVPKDEDESKMGYYEMFKDSFMKNMPKVLPTEETESGLPKCSLNR